MTKGWDYPRPTGWPSKPPPVDSTDELHGRMHRFEIVFVFCILALALLSIAYLATS